MQDQLFQMLIQKDEITWQTLLLDLVKNGDLDPWDVDISLLAQKYLEAVKELQEMNLYVSGKMLLASAILLKIKSEKLLTEGITILDNIMYPQEQVHDFTVDYQGRLLMEEKPRLTVKNPQARKRRVTITDLMSALEKAMAVNQRRIKKVEERNWIPTGLEVPEKTIDISDLIEKIYKRVVNLLLEKDKMKFSELIPSESRKDKLMTFVPLLYLATQSKVNLSQDKAFADFDIKIMR